MKISIDETPAEASSKQRFIVGDSGPALFVPASHSTFRKNDQSSSGLPTALRSIVQRLLARF